jgi:hypothetical protein
MTKQEYGKRRVRLFKQWQKADADDASALHHAMEQLANDFEKEYGYRPIGSEWEELAKMEA